jgi:hypothetical protein
MILGLPPAMSAVLCLTYVLAGGPVLPPIQIAVRAPAGIPSALIQHVCAETDAIWRPAGITFEWHRVTSDDDSGDSQLVVTIDDQRKTGRPGQAPLGWITFTAGVPEKSIHLSRRTAEELLLRTADLPQHPIMFHDMLVGRALGRALSHEVGHYLLESRDHTTQGLMRALVPSDQFFALGRFGFELTAEERALAAWHVHTQDRSADGS